VKRPTGGRVGQPQESAQASASKPIKPEKPAKAPKPPRVAKSPKTAKTPRHTRVEKRAAAISAKENKRIPRAARKELSAAAEARRELREAVKARKAFERNEIRRFTAHLRRRRIAFFTILGSVIGLAIFVGVGVFSPLMALQKVVVVGASRVDASAIVADLSTQLGKPLPLVDTHIIEATLAKQPLVKSYSTQSIPPHTLIVNIVERSPIGYLRTAQGFSLVDPAGVSIEITKSRTVGAPLIEVNGGSATAQGFSAAVAVIQALPSTLHGEVDRVFAATTDDVSIILKGSGVRVVWGAPDKSALKARVLTSLMKAYPPSRRAVYDVSSPESVVVR
jgi:cell division protein FtsQ